jgi:transaldolase
LEAKGIDLNAITTQLQIDGVKAFSDAFHSLLNSIEQKKNSLLGEN